MEEIVNAFTYDYEPPTAGELPIKPAAALAVCPWQPKHVLTRLTLKAKELEPDELPPANLVFLIDVSGSMGWPDKLPLAKQALWNLADRLRPQDRVAIVT